MSPPRLPASDRQRVRDAGAVAEGSGRRHRTVHGVRAHLGRRRGDVSLLPGLRRDGLLDDRARGLDDSIAVPIGAFLDPSFPQPTVSIYGSRRYPWLSFRTGSRKARLVLPRDAADVERRRARRLGARRSLWRVSVVARARRSAHPLARLTHLVERIGETKRSRKAQDDSSRLWLETSATPADRGAGGCARARCLRARRPITRASRGSRA